MIKFLTYRPIAVLMSFAAFVILGVITYFTLPVSLLPDIAIPQITVQVSGTNTSARALENTIVSPLRQQLMQVTVLENMTSHTRDGNALIRLNFDYGVNTDLAFIEVNEKIDAAMNNLPKGTQRPKVIKASATDLPVFYVSLTVDKSPDRQETDEEAFLNLCVLAESVIKRRIEQLPEIAMVDATGLVDSRVQIVPDPDKLVQLGLTIQDIEAALTANNVEAGSMKVRNGYYEYNIKFSTILRTADDVANIYIRKGERILQLKEFCRIGIVPVKEEGIATVNGQRAVMLAIIKQANATMDNMKDALDETLNYFRQTFPQIHIQSHRNQTELLDYTLANLRQNLVLGFLLICIVAVLFLGDVKSPFIIGLSMVVSILVSFLFFYLFKISLNIISLSGIILALGMMIDNSIIVTENISQYRERGFSLRRSCVYGTNEVITPMLSSSLTTIAVFVPLVFMSGIAGAIFFDQAISVTIGLMISYITGIMLLPVLYLLVYSAGMRLKRHKSWLTFTFKSPINDRALDKLYDKGVHFTFTHKTFSVLFCIIAIPLCVFLFTHIKTERMPAITQNELIVKVDWNENIHVDENRRRTDEVFAALKTPVTEKLAAIGKQDYLLGNEQELSASEAEWYFKTSDASDIAPLQQEVIDRLRSAFPLAVVGFAPPQTVFEKIFTTGDPDLIAEFYARNAEKTQQAEVLRELEKRVIRQTGEVPEGLPFLNQLNLSIDRGKLILYNVSANEIYRILRTAFRENEVTILRSFQQYLPIVVADEAKTVNAVLRETLIPTMPDQRTGEINYIPLSELVRVTSAEDLKSITAGRNGEYVPFAFHNPNHIDQIMKGTKEVAVNDGGWDVGFSGTFFSNRDMMREMVIILLVSILLMYFILAAQFESFLQPLLVLVEIPIDVAFGLLVLWLCGHTLNLMSAIGLIVTCGIVINDSILKLDAINELRKQGMPLLNAIHEAGRRRLRPIIMTSLTTILAMVPLLFSSDMGSELQQPLAIAMIGTMSIGTLVSLFIVPLLYWFIYQRKEHTSI